MGYNHLEQRQGKPRRSQKSSRFLILICTRLEEYLDRQYESPGERLLAGVSDFALRRGRELEVHDVSPSDMKIDSPSYAVIGSAKECVKRHGQEAIEMQKTLTESVPFAQCWDPQGWFWKPADAARKQIKSIEFALIEQAE